MAFPTTSVIETFTGANDTSPPNANWTEVYGGVDIQSNQAAGETSGGNDAFWDTSTFGADSEAYITVNTAGAGNHYLFVRMTTLVISTTDGYGLIVDQADTPDSWTIVEYLNAVSSDLGSATQNIANGEKLGLEIIGTAIKAYHYTGGAWNQTPIVSTTDGTYSSAGYIGFGISGTTGRMDDFGGGTYVAGGEPSGPEEGSPGTDSYRRRVQHIRRH